MHKPSKEEKATEDRGPLNGNSKDMAHDKGCLNGGFVQTEPSYGLCTSKKIIPSEVFNEASTLKQGNHNDVRNSEEIPGPDGGWGWVVCFACFMECLLYDGIFYTFGIIFLDLTDSFNSSKGSGAWITSMGFGVCFTSGPIISVMINRLGLRAVTIIGSITACSGLVMSSFAPSIQFLYFSYGLVVGFGYGLVYQPSIIAVTMYFNKRRSLATGLALCGNGLGVFIMSPVTEWLLRIYSWRGTFLIQGALLLNGILCGLVYLPLVRNSKDDEMKEKDFLETKTNVNRKEESNVDNNVGIREFLTPKTGCCKDMEQNKETFEKQENIFMTNNSKLGSSKDARTTNFECTQPTRPTAFTKLRVCSILEQDPCGISAYIFSLGNQTFCNMETRRSTYKARLKSLCTRPVKKRIVLKIQTLTRSLLSAVCELFDFSLLKQVPFCLYVISSTLYQLSYYIPFVYLPDLANLAGISPFQAAWLLSSIGVSNIVSRATFGVLTDRPNVNRVIVYSVCVFISGIAIIAKPFAGFFEGLLFLAIVFGLCQGLSMMLISVLVADLVGTKHVTTGLGIRNLFSGIATFVGPPFAGWMFDITRNYDLPFYFFGAVTSISGAILFVIPCLKNPSDYRR